MILEKILGGRESVEVEVSDADRAVGDRKDSEIQQAEEKFSQLRAELEEIIEDLVRFFSDLEDYQDTKNRPVIEDVVDNVAQERRETLQEFDLPTTPGQMQEELDSILEDLQDMKRKEAAVLEEAHLGKKVSRKLRRLEQKKQELEDFIDQEYSVKREKEQLEELVSKLEETRKESVQLEQELEEVGIQQKREKLEEKEDQIEQFRETDEWDEYRRLQQQKEDLEEERQTILEEVGRSMSMMERGLKKLVYRIENTGTEFRSDLDVLKNIRDGERDEVLEKDGVPQAVSEAVEKMPDDLLGKRQMEKFREGAEEMKQLGERKKRLEELKSQVAEKKEEIEQHPAAEKLEELEKERENLEQEVHHLKDKKDRMEEELAGRRKEKKRIRKDIKQGLREALDAEIEFK